jgi:signal transduction histidine kinase
LKSHNFKLWLAVGWLVFTTAMVLWWWILGLQEITNSSKYTMLMSEGLFFLFAILAGGGALIFLLLKDQERHQQLKNFFNLFSHDLKTSISRLRLQAEILQEDERSKKDPNLLRLLGDINRLDLQLENSLLYSQGDRPLDLQDQVLLSQIIESVKNEWAELDIRLDGDARLTGDRRSLMSIFRNLFQNAQNHAHSSKISIRVKTSSPGKLKLSVSDHGPGYSGDLNVLGKTPFPISENEGSGIGLYLCRFLAIKQKGDLEFTNESGLGLTAHLTVSGEVLL